MRFENRDSGLVVEVTNNALETGYAVVTYREVVSGREHSLCREWFTKWFMEAPEKWVAVVSKDDESGLYYYDLIEDRKGAGACTGFKSECEAIYHAARMTERMNAADFYK